MLLDILDNLPHLRLSSHSIKLMLWMLKELGVSKVPSFNGFRAMQESLRLECGITPKAHVSDFKNHYHSISLRDTIAKDFANPHVAPHINLYPERINGLRCESWQFDRWTEFLPSQLTPMFSRALKQFWIEEIAQLSNGAYKELYSDCSIVQVTLDGQWIITDQTQFISASEMLHNYDAIIVQLGDTAQIQMPNPLQALAGGDDLYVVMVPLWCNDVSGNKSKQYNKHVNIYSVNGSLPGQMLQQEYFVNFVSTSPNATPLEQFTSLHDEIRNPIRCYNAATGRACRVILRIPVLPADNPAQSEEASHMGGNSNHPCWKCKIGGNHKDTETPNGYHCFFWSIWHTADEIKVELQKQMEAAMTGVEAKVTKLQTESGVKDRITETWIEKLISRARAYKADTDLTDEEITTNLAEWLDKEPGEKMNPLLDITGLDPSQDTPVEILHTVLLGIVKYIWYMTHSAMSEKDLELLAIRLQSTDIDGLTVPPLRAAYMIQYRNNLIGKHFKTLMQILPFHIHDFTKLDQAHFTLVRSVRQLGSLLWDDIKVSVGNVLDALADVAPSKILVKIKLHLLTHLPSQDIAYKFASMGQLKHLLSSGFWQQRSSHGVLKWVQASDAVRSFLKDVPIIQRHLGWVLHTNPQHGKVTLKSCARAIPTLWTDTRAAVASIEAPPPNIVWLTGDSPMVIVQTGGSCTIGSWVFAQTEELGANLHEDFLCPILRQCIPNAFAAAIKFCFLAQHDSQRCRLQIQNRQITEWTQLLLNHANDDNFVINMYGLHNAMILCEALPQHLWKPAPLYENRRAKHDEIVEVLVVTQAAKRAQTQEKTRATKERNKAAKNRETGPEQSTNGNLESEEGVANAQRRRI
ncbi:hypothetical protein DFJ43DRAFT_1128788 [Lentinula guzmanii]|uniref:Uncharacterized protein n=1 Tax=Lentinula guzmanii TaxID=2804957 RepID=A0AA38JLI0_9AGAR|nr:hypothetical protein DFJ43DRAFT_1128788 [Lentinula guzmanii]